MVPAKVTAFSFHTSLLVALCRCTELRLEPPVRSEGDESRGLLSLVSSQNLFHRTLEVVVTKSFENSRKISERPFVRFQKRLLAGVREGAMESSSAGHAAHAKYVGQLSLSADIRVSFIPVHLRLSTPSIGLRNERLLADQSQLNLPLPNVSTNRGLSSVDFWHLRSDPAPDPVRGVPLLSWRCSVSFQNRLDESHCCFQFRPGSEGDLSLSGNCVGQCFAHHASVHPQLVGHSLDRSHTVCVLTSNLLK